MVVRASARRPGGAARCDGCGVWWTGLPAAGAQPPVRLVVDAPATLALLLAQDAARAHLDSLLEGGVVVVDDVELDLRLAADRALWRLVRAAGQRPAAQASSGTAAGGAPPARTAATASARRPPAGSTTTRSGQLPQPGPAGTAIRSARSAMPIPVAGASRGPADADLDPDGRAARDEGPDEVLKQRQRRGSGPRAGNDDAARAGRDPVTGGQSILHRTQTAGKRRAVQGKIPGKGVRGGT